LALFGSIVQSCRKMWHADIHQAQYGSNFAFVRVIPLNPVLCVRTNPLSLF